MERRELFRWSVVGIIGAAGCSAIRSTDDTGDDRNDGGTDRTDAGEADESGENTEHEDGADDTDQRDESDGSDETGATNETSDEPGGLEGRWPAYQYDSRNSGYDPDGNGPGPDAAVTWSVDIGSGLENGGSTPVVGGDALYVGTGAGDVYALETSDGSERWRSETHKWIHSTPALTAETVVVGSDDTNVYGFDRDDGTERWSARTDFEVPASPAIVDDVAYVTSTKGTVYALDVASGDVRWETALDQTEYVAPLAVAGDRVFVGGYEGIYALGVDDGSLEWQRDAAVGWTPVVDGNRVYGVSRTAGELYAVAVEDGRDLFRRDLDVERPDHPAVADGTAFVGFEDGLLAVDSSGDVRWECELPAPAATPAIVDRTVYCAATGTVFAVDRTDGSVRWSVEYGDRAGPLAVVGEGIYLKDGKTIRRIGG